MFRSYKKIGTGLALLLLIALPMFVFARGGGGGSSSHGGGGGGGGSYRGGGSSGGHVSPPTPQYLHGSCWSSEQYQSESDCEEEKIISGIVFTFIFSCIALISLSPRILDVWRKRQRISSAEPVFSAKARELYFQFQKAWSEFDVATLQAITTHRFYEQLVLELAVLKNEKRENRMIDTELKYAYVNPKKYNSQENVSSFKAEIQGRAKDVLFDVELQQELYKDSSWFVEYWTFIKEGEIWKLDTIEQTTATSSSVSKGITDFAAKNNFFYNPDFGWLMIPNRGNLFSKASFKNSDINNHVIGVYKNKIVEFYSIIFRKDDPEYFIGQAILPRSYSHIVIERKNKFSLFERLPSGLRKIELESVAFNEEFNVYSDNADTMTTFELLHPVFMEYIMGLPYKVNIEVVGNTIYFYTTLRDKNGDEYDKLLEILSRAFDEIKE